MKTTALLFSMCFIILIRRGQNVGISNSAVVPHPSALLHVNTEANHTKGLLVTGAHSESATLSAEIIEAYSRPANQFANHLA